MSGLLFSGTIVFGTGTGIFSQVLGGANNYKIATIVMSSNSIVTTAASSGGLNTQYNSGGTNLLTLAYFVPAGSNISNPFPLLVIPFSDPLILPRGNNLNITLTTGMGAANLVQYVLATSVYGSILP